MEYTKTPHEGRGNIEHRLETPTNYNKRIEELPPKEVATKSIHDGTTSKSRRK